LLGLASRLPSLLGARQQELSKEEAACDAAAEEVYRAEENGAHMHARLRKLLAQQSQAAAASGFDTPSDVCRCVCTACAQQALGVVL
jgi:hypothetical protein